MEKDQWRLERLLLKSFEQRALLPFLLPQKLDPQGRAGMY